MKFKKTILFVIIIISILIYISICINNFKKYKDEIVLYYVDGNNFKLVPVITYIEKPKTSKKILNMLIKGENKGNLENLIPKETKILGIEEKKNVIKINLSEEFKGENKGITSSKLQIMSIVNTIVDSTKFKFVKLLLNGEEKIIFNQTVYIKDPIQKDESLIK